MTHEVFDTLAAPCVLGHQRVFVYGSLKKGFGNHGVLDNSKFLGYGCLPFEGVMFHWGVYPAVSAEDKISNIHGEIYEIAPETLTALDQLESHPKYYKRTQCLMPRYGYTWWYEINKDRVNERNEYIVPDGMWKGPHFATQRRWWNGWGKGYVKDTGQPSWGWNTELIGDEFINEINEASRRLSMAAGKPPPTFRTQRAERADEFIMIEITTGEAYGPFKAEGWSWNKAGKEIPKVKPQVSVAVREAIQTGKPVYHGKVGEDNHIHPFKQLPAPEPEKPKTKADFPIEEWKFGLGAKVL